MHQKHLRANIHTMTTKDLEVLKARIKELYPKRAVGDLNEKAFQQGLTERTLDFYRALVKMKTTKDEHIIKEHHIVQSHFRLTKSVLREPEQENISIFATDRRVFYLKSSINPNQPPDADMEDKISIEQVSLSRIKSVKVRRQIRIGEMGMGGAIAGMAVLFHSHLSITGPFMIGLGIIGMLHGLLLPTRWAEVKTFEQVSNPIMIYALRKKSSREMVRFLREKMRHT